MTRTLCMTAMILAAGWTCGCGAGPLPPEAQPIADRDFTAFWDAAIEVLRDYRFEVDRADRRSGLITTYPMLARHWFEFWRPDAAAAGDVLEGTLQTVRRQAIVRITRPTSGPATAPGEGGYTVAVEVLAFRSDRPAARVTSASEAYEMFLHPESLARGTAGSDPGEVQRPKTVDLGRDAGLEGVLLVRIRSLAQKKLTIYPR